MVKLQKMVKPKHVMNILLVSLIILTIGSYLFCGDVKENITNEVNKVKDFKTENGLGVSNAEPSSVEEDPGVSNAELPSEEDGQENKQQSSEEFLDWSMYNPPIVNGYTPGWWNRLRSGNNPIPQGGVNLDAMYNPMNYPNRSQAFYEQGWYPNMSLPPQVIGCGGRRGPCLGGTQETIPVISPPIEISERNIAPVNIISRSFDPDAVGVLRQVGVLYKIFGDLNEIFPLYGVKRYRNSDTWDYSTKVGKEGNFVHVKVLTRRINNNELQTNDVVRIDANSAKFRVTMYDNFPRYMPEFRS